MNSKKSCETGKFLDMVDLVEICTERPLEGVKTKQGRLKERATISFRKKSKKICIYTII